MKRLHIDCLVFRLSRRAWGMVFAVDGVVSAWVERRGCRTRPTLDEAAEFARTVDWHTVAPLPDAPQLWVERMAQRHAEWLVSHVEASSVVQ